ncbi:MAG: hypothetical protein NZ529_04560 [Cytophagaceae bacterium]|nr:hypothetical protein [Cytophagaceae bacterium]MDW8456047.1 hypothetical protein [Cytophagaceae bacterium]
MAKKCGEIFFVGRAPAGPGCPPLRYRSGAPLKLRTGRAGHGSRPMYNIGFVGGFEEKLLGDLCVDVG